jgi:uncharacterized repeat protein (TIGR01451 family)
MFSKIIIVSLLCSSLLFSQNPVSNIKLEKAVFMEEIAIDTLGIKTKKLIPVQDKMVQNGATLVYVNRLTNTSRILKKDIVVINPIPFKTAYLRGSATCEGSCNIMFSIDGGKSFDYGENLYVRYGKNKRVALGSEYTHIRFLFPSLPPFSKIRMAFKSHLK